MLKNVTMGQYYPVDSAVHRLDPRMKLILTILFIVAVFMSHSFAISNSWGRRAIEPSSFIISMRAPAG